jgi:hypothetical protein
LGLLLLLRPRGSGLRLGEEAEEGEESESEEGEALRDLLLLRPRRRLASFSPSPRPIFEIMS